MYKIKNSKPINTLITRFLHSTASIVDQKNIQPFEPAKFPVTIEKLLDLFKCRMAIIDNSPFNLRRKLVSYILKKKLAKISIMLVENNVEIQKIWQSVLLEVGFEQYNVKEDHRFYPNTKCTLNTAKNQCTINFYSRYEMPDLDNQLVIIEGIDSFYDSNYVTLSTVSQIFYKTIVIDGFSNKPNQTTNALICVNYLWPKVDLSTVIDKAKITQELLECFGVHTYKEKSFEIFIMKNKEASQDIAETQEFEARHGSLNNLAKDIINKKINIEIYQAFDSMVNAYLQKQKVVQLANIFKKDHAGFVVFSQTVKNMINQTVSASKLLKYVEFDQDHTYQGVSQLCLIEIPKTLDTWKTILENCKKHQIKLIIPEPNHVFEKQIFDHFSKKLKLSQYANL